MAEEAYLYEPDSRIAGNDCKSEAKGDNWRVCGF
jgi:hypothetical protein